jgi:pimeloyl-ACP methyl ester carboxylesterase
MFHEVFHFVLVNGVRLASALLPAAPLLSQKLPPVSVVKNIVLVHGAFADGSSWSKVIPLLEEMGYHVVAVQNPMTSLADEVAFTKRIIALQDGPVILVGHSWGGAVITQAGNDPQVAALVYVAAYAPEVGQSANDASAPFGWTEGQKQIRVDSNNFATITPEGMLEDIAEGLPMAERKLALAVQGQSYGPMFDEKLTVAAWKTKPTWALISANDRMVPPAMEASAAKRMGAVTTTLPYGHSGRAGKGSSGDRPGGKRGVNSGRLSPGLRSWPLSCEEEPALHLYYLPVIAPQRRVGHHSAHD